MRTLVLLLLSLCIKGQQWPGCNLSGQIPSIIVPPYTTTNFSLYATMDHTLHLCGPNTIAYDTLGAGHGAGPHVVLIDSGATYISKESDNLEYIFFAIKNWGTLILLLNPDSNAFPTSLSVVHEPLATIINNSGFGFQNINCPSITFPNVNCGTSTNVDHIISENTKSKFELFPNPVDDYLNLLINNGFEKTAYKSVIYNAQGTLLRQDEIHFENDKSRIFTGRLEPGFYIIQLSSLDGFTMKKSFIVKR
jgi:hypothetical protein